MATAAPALCVVPYEVPAWGTGELVYAHGVLIDHTMPRLRRVVRPVGAPLPEALELAARLRAYLGGARDTFLDLDLRPTLEQLGTTPFESAVVEEMRRVPYGETVSYGELAERAGRLRAARAAGNVCARGTLEVIVPYHRVIASDGSIGSYGADGLPRKRRLLALEGVHL